MMPPVKQGERHYELDKTNAFVAHADKMLTTVNVLSVVDRGVIKNTSLV